jgi:hypothetical protein
MKVTVVTINTWVNAEVMAVGVGCKRYKEFRLNNEVTIT